MRHSVTHQTVRCLVIGLGGQLIWWDESLCQDLITRGHYVIRYDNRDTGLSTKFDHAGKPDVMGAFGKILSGDRSNVPYTIEDMADDGVELLDALGIPCAHICGMSMGGMIAQTIALRHSSRVLSLTSIYSKRVIEAPAIEARSTDGLAHPDPYRAGGVDTFQIVDPGSPDNDVFHVSTQQN